MQERDRQQEEHPVVDQDAHRRGRGRHEPVDPETQGGDQYRSDEQCYPGRGHRRPLMGDPPPGGEGQPDPGQQGEHRRRSTGEQRPLRGRGEGVRVEGRQDVDGGQPDQRQAPGGVNAHQPGLPRGARGGRGRRLPPVWTTHRRPPSSGSIEPAGQRLVSALSLVMCSSSWVRPISGLPPVVENRPARPPAAQRDAASSLRIPARVLRLTAVGQWRA